MGESAGAANLRVLTSSEIEASGQTNLANLLRKIPEIGAQGFAENRVNTSSPGSAAISLRGLGVNSTLVLHQWASHHARPRSARAAAPPAWARSSSST
jgi:outer membrane receptor for ferrienterochelin and colicin